MIGIYPTLIENISFKESVKQGFTQTGSLVKQTVGFLKPYSKERFLKMM